MIVGGQVEEMIRCRVLFLATGPVGEPIESGVRAERRGGAVRSRRAHRPLVEGLETRITPLTVSTVHWTGGGGSDGRWSNSANWDQAPTTDAEVIFPAGLANESPVNDTSGTFSLTRMEIDGAGYTFSGGPVSLAEDLSTTYSAGTSTDAMNTTLGTGTVSVATGGTLYLYGKISGSAGMAVSGGGTLEIQGLNDYTGQTTITDAGTTLLVDGLATAVQVNPGAILGVKVPSVT